jgi:signal transduction histidine kinase
MAIVRAQGGVIECESSPAAGSLFTIILPANSSDEAVAGSAPKQKLILS